MVVPPLPPPPSGDHVERRAFPRTNRFPPAPPSGPPPGQPGTPYPGVPRTSASAVSWEAFVAEQPLLAARVRERFAAHTHLTMATIRANGTPRVSGTEVRIRGGVLYLAGMVGARRFDDLRARPAVAIHSGSDDAARWTGDAKITGRAREVTDGEERAAFAASLEQEPPGGTFELFVVDLTEATTVELTPELDALIITTWVPVLGVRTFRR